LKSPAFRSGALKLQDPTVKQVNKSDATALRDKLPN